jgi:hypothetical protein
MILLMAGRTLTRRRASFNSGFGQGLEHVSRAVLKNEIVLRQKTRDAKTITIEGQGGTYPYQTASLSLDSPFPAQQPRRNLFPELDENRALS